MSIQFKDLQLNKPILKAIADKNYETPTPIQVKTIPLVLDKKDVIASAQTGTGKTAAYALPILQMLYDKQDAPKKGKKIRALVVSPTRELALQISASFKSYSTYTNLRTTVVYGGTSIDQQSDVLNKGVDILIATPGRLLDLYKQEIVDLRNIETLVLDEADLMLDMGFIEDVFKIVRICPDQKQILLFSATMPDKVVFLANTILKNAKQSTCTFTHYHQMFETCEDRNDDGGQLVVHFECIEQHLHNACINKREMSWGPRCDGN